MYSPCSVRVEYMVKVYAKHEVWDFASRVMVQWENGPRVQRGPDRHAPHPRECIVLLWCMSWSRMCLTIQHGFAIRIAGGRRIADGGEPGSPVGSRLEGTHHDERVFRVFAEVGGANEDSAAMPNRDNRCGKVSSYEPALLSGWVHRTESLARSAKTCAVGSLAR